MIGIKSRVNKDYTTQFSIKSRKDKILDRKFQMGKMSFFLTIYNTLNGPYESGFL